MWTRSRCPGAPPPPAGAASTGEWALPPWLPQPLRSWLAHTGSAVHTGCTCWNAAAPSRPPAGNSTCFCPTLYHPVCGVSGKVFSNSCVAQCVKAPVRYTCGKRKDCTKSCRAAAAKAKPAPKPAPKPKPCVCTKEFKPVCGKDGKVYPNACMAKARGLLLA